MKIDRKSLAYHAWKYKQSINKFYILYKRIMKNLRLLALLWIVLVSATLVGCESNKDENIDKSGDFIIEDVTWENDAVIDYNDNLVDIASACIETADAAWDTLANAEATIQDLKDYTNKAIEDCTNSINAINKLWDWEKDSSLKDGAISLLEKYVAWFTKFEEGIPYIDSENPVADENWSFDKIMEEVAQIDNEINALNSELSTIQYAFAESHGFSLESVDEVEEGSGVVEESSEVAE